MNTQLAVSLVLVILLVLGAMLSPLLTRSDFIGGAKDTAWQVLFLLAGSVILYFFGIGFSFYLFAMCTLIVPLGFLVLMTEGDWVTLRTHAKRVSIPIIFRR